MKFTPKQIQRGNSHELIFDNSLLCCSKFLF